MHIYCKYEIIKRQNEHHWHLTAVFTCNKANNQSVLRKQTGVYRLSNEKAVYYWKTNKIESYQLSLIDDCNFIVYMQILLNMILCIFLWWTFFVFQFFKMHFGIATSSPKWTQSGTTTTQPHHGLWTLCVPKYLQAEVHLCRLLAHLRPGDCGQLGHRRPKVQTFLYLSPAWCPGPRK